MMLLRKRIKMIKIKCSVETCNEYQDVEDDVIGWYCKPCMERIMNNMKAELKNSLEWDINILGRGKS